jgi:hypothetical protein
MKKTLSSPLVAAANNIVSLGSRSNSLPRFQRDFNSFSRFLEVENRSLEKLKLPDKKKIRALASLNIASNFGRPGNLLSSLFSGALDLGGFVGNMFPGRGKLGKPQRPSNVKPPKPTIKGPRLKLGGMRAVGVGNALFAGLDFATGLAEGESVGKSAAGAGGALAGSLLGGAIGQALIPIPGLGFVVGSMAGSFLGGYAADRVYEGGSALKQKLSEKLKGQEAKQKTLTGGSGSFSETISKFDAAVSRFDRGVAMGLFGTMEQIQPQQIEDTRPGDTDAVDPNYKPLEPPSDSKGGGGGTASGLAKAASESYGMTSADNPQTEGGKVGCVWAVNKVYRKMGIDPPWGGSLYVPDAVSAMKKSGYSTVQRKNIQSGDIYIAPNEHHIGIVLDNNTILSNSSSKGSFSWKDSPEGYAQEYGREGTYYRPNFTQTKKDQKVDPTKQERTTKEKLVQDTKNPIKQGKENVVIGDSIAKGQMDATGKKGKAVVGASPDKVMGYINEMNQNGRIKGNTVELSSGLANNVKDIGNVQKQLESLKSMGAASVLLSGTAKSGNRKDQIQANKELAALAAKYPGFVKFGGGFTPGADNVHPADAAAYNKQLTAMQAIVQPAPQAQVVPAAAPPVPQIQTYPSYNQPQSSMTVMPIMMGGGGGGQQRPVYIPVGGGGGGGTVIMPGPTEGQVVNSLMKTMLLTNLSAT